MSTTLETSVLVIGAGPVGLAMAIELGSRNVENILLEQTDGNVEHPRTGLVAVRTMEAFRRWGIAEQVRHCGFPGDYNLSMIFCTSLNGMLLDKENYPSMDEAPTPATTPEKKQRCPQLWLHPILQARANETQQTTVKYRHKLEGFEQTETHVIAHVTDLATDQPVTIKSEYLVGCDGGGSGIRQALNVPMTGKLLGYSVNILMRIPRLTDYHTMGEGERYLFVGPEGTWGNLTVVDGDEIWRLTVLGSEQKMDLANFDALSYVHRALGRTDVPVEILSVIPWRRSETLADRYRKNRVILAGDSVHTMSPTGGMGMNTGIQEVLDLGWKLQAVLTGWGAPALLDSYEIERRPIAARNIRFSSQNYQAWMDVPDTRAICDATDEGASVRAAMGKRLRESTRVEWESLGLQIGYRYDKSPICVPDGTATVADDFSVYIPNARPGARAPHAWLEDGRSTLDLFGNGFALLAFESANPADIALLEKAMKEKNVPVQVIHIGDQDVARLYEKALVLVRPDGHVAWRGDTVINTEEIVATIRGETISTHPQEELAA